MQILHHINDLLRFTIRMFEGGERLEAPPGDPTDELKTLQSLLPILDRHLARSEPTGILADRQVTLAMLLQGPLTDAITHVGQLSMLRRMAGFPASYENYLLAAIQPGEFPPIELS